MSRNRMSWSLLALVAGVLIATVTSCSGDGERPPAASGVFSGTGAGGSSADSGEGDTAGSGAVAEGDAAGAEANATVCGNGLAEDDEPCDGEDLDEETCETLGFNAGNLACIDCQFDVTGCSGTERCYDAVDNDGDGDTDCDDGDCVQLCTEPCASPIPLADPGVIQGYTWGHPGALQSSCIAAGASSGPELVFQLTPVNTGVVEVLLTAASSDFTASARAQCADSSAELACSNYALGAGAVERIVAPAQQGVPLFIVVDGADADQEGAFELSAWSRAIVCGDGKRDPGEPCDDANAAPGDSCSTDCELLSSETEPNDTVANADQLVTRFTGALDPEGDIDVVAVVVENPLSSIVALVRDLGDGACNALLMDPAVELRADAGAMLLAEDDDSGPGLCAYVTLGGLSPGVYHVIVRAAGGAQPTFPYRLDVTVDWCGSTIKSDVEECDDGNTVGGDGCSPTCTTE